MSFTHSHTQVTPGCNRFSVKLNNSALHLKFDKITNVCLSFWFQLFLRVMFVFLSVINSLSLLVVVVVVAISQILHYDGQFVLFR